uniref:Reverse transcriptase Ty1/copia-type domain-containing protein n=1 Tax=Bracon brevicornis TaxID=1563983 RepID=A0A6V7IJ44_9HYME
MALTEAAKEALYLKRFLGKLGFNNLNKIVLFSDNHGAQKLAKNAVFHSRTKHIDVRHHFIREILESGENFQINYIPTDDTTADILTKGLPRPKHQKCLKLLGIERSKM